MGGIEKDHEINEIVKDIIADFDGGRNIDAKKLFNNPDKTGISETVPIRSIIRKTVLR